VEADPVVKWRRLMDMGTPWTGEEVCRPISALVLLCAKGTAKPLAMLRHILDRLELTLNETKTKVVNAWDESFDFFGFEVRMILSRRGKAYPHIQPSKRSVKRINAKLTELTARKQIGRFLTMVGACPLLHPAFNHESGWPDALEYAICGKVQRCVQWSYRSYRIWMV
jgi:hypothetical protein